MDLDQKATGLTSLQKWAYKAPDSTESPTPARSPYGGINAYRSSKLPSQPQSSHEIPVNSSSPSTKRKRPRTSLPPPSSTAPDAAVNSPSPSKKRKSSGYAPPSKYAHITNHLRDALLPDLICLYIGVNPGLQTARSGHAYAHPSNLFWKLAYRSGCTPRLCKPSEDVDLPHLYALGHTNIVARPTKDASELSKQEMAEGVAVLEEKCRKWRPECVCLVGKSIWETVFRVRRGRGIRKEEFRYGWQDKSENMGVVPKGKGGEDAWGGARMFVATTTSGLAAGMTTAEKEAVWKGLGEFVERRRREKGIPDEGMKRQAKGEPGQDEKKPTI